MQVCYQPEMQDYVGISLSMFGSRVFYNKDLFKKLTGLDTCPTNYHEFLAVCEKIKGQKNKQGKSYIAIAGSKYHSPIWEGLLCDLVSYSMLNGSISTMTEP